MEKIPVDDGAVQVWFELVIGDPVRLPLNLESYDYPPGSNLMTLESGQSNYNSLAGRAGDKDNLSQVCDVLQSPRR